MLNILLRTMNGVFCRHEWITRSRPGVMYVECVKCLGTSSGIALRGDSTERTQPQRLTVATGVSSNHAHA